VNVDKKKYPTNILVSFQACKKFKEEKCECLPTKNTHQIFWCHYKPMENSRGENVNVNKKIKIPNKYFGVITGQ